MSIYMDHSVKFCVLRHKLYHVVSSKTWIILHVPAVKYMLSSTLSGQAIVRDKVLDCVWSTVVSGNCCVCMLGM